MTICIISDSASASIMTLKRTDGTGALADIDSSLMTFSTHSVCRLAYKESHQCRMNLAGAIAVLGVVLSASIASQALKDACPNTHQVPHLSAFLCIGSQTSSMGINSTPHKGSFADNLVYSTKIADSIERASDMLAGKAS